MASFFLLESFKIVLTALRMKTAKPWVWVLWLTSQVTLPQECLYAAQPVAVVSSTHRPSLLHPLPCSLPFRVCRERRTREGAARPFIHHEETSLLFPQANEVFLVTSHLPSFTQSSNEARSEEPLGIYIHNKLTYKYIHTIDYHIQYPDEGAHVLHELNKFQT